MAGSYAVPVSVPLPADARSPLQRAGLPCDFPSAFQAGLRAGSGPFAHRAYPVTVRFPRFGQTFAS